MASRSHALDPVADEVRRHDEALRRAVVRMLLAEIDKVEDPEERRMLREDLARGRGDFSRERMEQLVRDYERTLRERRALPRRRRRAGLLVAGLGALVAAGGWAAAQLAGGLHAEVLGPVALVVGAVLAVIGLVVPANPAQSRPRTELGEWLEEIGRESNLDNRVIGIDWSRPDDTLIVSPTYRDLPENIWHQSDSDLHYSGYDR